MNSDMTFIALIIIGLLTFITSFVVSIYRQALRANTLLSLIAYRRRGQPRSGVVIPWPHIDYNEPEEDGA